MQLTNARWLGQDGTWHEGSITLEGHRIAALHPHPHAPSPHSPQLDCSGLLVLPGAIDPHVHFREPGYLHKEGIENGCRAAIRGGVTTILDMPNTNPPCCSRQEHEAKRLLFSEKAPVNWGLFLDVSVLGNAQAWPRKERPIGKLYMAKSSPARPVRDIPSVAQIFSDYPLISIHAEDEEFLNPAEPLHHIARPREAVVAALKTIEAAWELASPKPRLVLCHLGTREEVEWLRAMKRKGADIAGETCAHYVLLTQDDYVRDGNIYKVNPPLRTSDDTEAIREALRDGTIRFLATDHAPHLPEEKSSSQPPSGIAGIEWYYPLAFHIAKVADLSLGRLHELVCTGAARTFPIPQRDGIAVGNFADLAILEQTSPHSAEVVTKAATRPFAHLPLQHSMRHVFVNGHLVFSNGSFLSAPRGMEALLIT